MKIYLVRHGESVDDVEDSYGGIADFPLTEEGQRTAQELCSELTEAGIEVLYSSPYKRAQETAFVISQVIKCEIRTVYNLRERNSYGVLSGVNKAKAKEIFGEVYNKITGKVGDYYSDELVIGAEGRADFDERVKNGFEEIIKDAEPYEVIGIVTHGNVTRSIYRNLLGEIGKVDLGLLAITVIKYDPPHITIEKKLGVEIQPL